MSGAPQPPAASGQGMVGYEREVGQENNGEDDSQSEGIRIKPTYANSLQFCIAHEMLSE